MEGNLQKSPTSIVRAFKDFMTAKYNTIITDDRITCIARDAGQKVPPAANATFEMPITMKLQAAAKQRKT